MHLRGDQDAEARLPRRGEGAAIENTPSRPLRSDVLAHDCVEVVKGNKRVRINRFGGFCVSQLILVPRLFRFVEELAY
jgi:hypothetical protein